MSYLGNDHQEYLHATFGRENLQKKYGGLLPDKVSDFFPPDLNVQAAFEHTVPITIEQMTEL